MKESTKASPAQSREGLIGDKILGHECPRREPRLVLRMAVALNDLQIVLKDPIEFLNRQERKPYPEKPRTTLEEMAEWLLDECGIEHDDQLVRRMAVALFAFQEITCKLGCYWPMPEKALGNTSLSWRA